MRKVGLLAALVCLGLGCTDDALSHGSSATGSTDDTSSATATSDETTLTGEPEADLPGDPTPNPDYPRLFVRPEHKPIVLDRIEREPYATALALLELRAATEPAVAPSPNAWHLDTELRNAPIVRSAAFLAWLFDDPAYADVALARLDAFAASFDTAPTTDSNIRMLYVTYAYTDAIDLLLGAGFLSEDEADVHIEKLLTLCEQIHAKFVADPIARQLYLIPGQNNHPIRTALAMAYVANAYPERTSEAAWRNWALSELDYLWGPTGHYLAADGSISEGPAYAQFAWAPSLAFYLAMQMTHNDDMMVTRDCVTRNDDDPWTDHGCVQDEVFVFTNAFDDPRFFAHVDWQLELRMPSGQWPPVDDARRRNFSSPALMTTMGGGGEYLWYWLSNVDGELPMSRGCYIAEHHLVHVDDSLTPVEPGFETVFHPDSGDAVLRSGWDPDARWLLLLAEHGDARKTLHDHVDGLSFQIAAYGEYLIMDPGYYKPNDLGNAETADSPAHNVLLIDGRSAPAKGVFTDFGDADAFLGATHDGEAIDYAEAWQEYQGTRVDRAVVMVDERYFVVADTLTTTAVDPREHAFRVSGNGGYDSGGSFQLLAEGARWERDLAGVDLYLRSTSSGMTVVEPAYVENTAPHVHDIGEGPQHHAVVDGVVSDLSPGFLAVLAPYQVGAAADAPEAPLLVEPVDLGPGAAAWTVTGADFVDLVLSREPEHPGPFVLPDNRVLTTDARLVVWRMQGDAFVLLARGTSLEIDAMTVIDGGDADAITVFEAL